MIRTVAGGVLVVSIASVVACQRAASPAHGWRCWRFRSVSYRAEIEKFRDAREAALKTDTGWLTIAGLFFLTKPETSFGSDPANDIVLPAGAPATPERSRFTTGRSPSRPRVVSALSSTATR